MHESIEIVIFGETDSILGKTNLILYENDSICGEWLDDLRE